MKNMEVQAAESRLELAFDLMLSYGVPDDKILLITELITDASVKMLRVKLEEKICSLRMSTPDHSSTTKTEDHQEHSNVSCAKQITSTMPQTHAEENAGKSAAQKEE